MLTGCNQEVKKWVWSVELGGSNVSDSVCGQREHQGKEWSRCVGQGYGHV